MQTLTSTQLSYLQNRGVLSATVNVDPVEGAPFAIDAKNIRELSIDRRAVTGQQIEIGNAYASELVLELENDEGIYSSVTWEGARVTVVLDIGGEPLQAGIFTVDEQPRKFSIMTINALDDMARFNRPYVTDLVFPATLEQILADACSKCNVTQHTLTFDNGDYVVSEKPSGDYTFHQIVNFVAEIAGCNAWIDHLSRLNMTWYGGTPAEIDHSLMYTHNMEEKDITITGVVYKAGEVDYVAGTEDYAIVVEDNPLLQDDYETVITALNSKLNGFTYRPYDIEMFRYPHLWPMDLVALRDGDGNLVNSVVMTHKVALVRGNSRIAAMGKTETVKGYATAAPLTPRQKRILETVAQTETERQLTDFEQSVLALNELMVNSLGFYSTAVEKPGGGKIIYSHDKPLLEESQIIWTQTEQGFAWTDQGWNDGNPVWQYGVTGDGSMVVKLLTAIGINADWINAGKIRADFVQIGAGTDFAAGYDPATKATPVQVAAAEAAAKAYADSAAAGAQTAATSLLGQLANGTYSGGSFIDGTTLYSPAVVGMTGAFLSLLAGNPSAAHLQMGETDGNPYLQMYDADNKLRVTLEQEYLKFTDPSGINLGYMRAYDGRMNIYTNTTAINSRSWIELWGDSVYPDRQGEIIMGADHFVWRIDGSTTSAGTDAMRLNADGSLSILGNIARGDNGRLNIYTNTTSKNSWAWMEFWGYDPNYGRSGEIMFGGSKFTVRLGSTDTSAGVDKLILDDSGLNAIDGLMENGIALVDKYASKSHTHSYLPLSGGVVDGNIIATGRVRANSYFQVGTAIGITQEVLYTDRLKGARTMQFTGGILTSWT